MPSPDWTGIAAIGALIFAVFSHVTSTRKTATEELRTRIDKCESERKKDQARVAEGRRERWHLRRKIGHLERHILTMDVFVGRMFPDWPNYEPDAEDPGAKPPEEEMDAEIES